jgi:EAL domain-containing protein (putative c-di-GMP-specific phosphodiesterase class I)
VGSSLLVSLERAFVVEDVPLHVGATFGVAASAGNGDAKTLMRRAEMAMYRAKAAGAPSAVFDTSDELGGPARLALAAQLRNAIGSDELHLHYQPKIEIETGRVTGVEALARWDHPDRGSISPGEFIPLAEQAGLILPITKRLLDEALTQCARWRADGIDLQVAVNLSPRVLNDPDLVEWTAASLAEHGVPGDSLIYEITENALAEGPRVLRAIAGLRALGIRLAIDDLGTGYSSLMYLKSLPVDELKIDRAFIAELAIDRRDQAIVRSIVELGRSLGLVVVAEGVEDSATLAVLRRLGCEVAQGYHCCRPASAADLTPWLAEQSVGSHPSGSSP